MLDSLVGRFAVPPRHLSMNRLYLNVPLTFLLSLAIRPAVAEVSSRPAVEHVEISADRVFHLNGKPFFPIMAWLQNPSNFRLMKECEMNTIAGYWPKSGGTRDVVEYIGLVDKAGLYGVMPFHPYLKGHAALFAYIHGDEPDLPHKESDADVVPAKHLHINRKVPLWKLLDGDKFSWSVLDPLNDASITVRLKEPVTVKSLALWLTVSKGLALAKDVSFSAGGKEVLKATLEPKKGRQQFELPQPATFQELEMKVLSTVPGDQVWGSMGEIEGFDATGKNVLLSKPRNVTRATPEKTAEHYKQIKDADPSRPVFMTFTGNFHPHFKKWPDEKRKKLYSDFIRSTDVVGYDIYPIYGWNRPDWIHLVYEATGLLAKMAGERPVYAWIETSKGGQWTGDLSRQHPVAPEHIRAEVWMAICQGATAIGYFTHIWKPSYNQFGVPKENREALAEINSQITRLTAAILGGVPRSPATVETEGGVKMGVMSREHDGSLYIFAVNYDERAKATEATFKVDGLKPGVLVEVVDEEEPGVDIAEDDEWRTVTSEEGQFQDTFEPFAVHIYRLKQP